MDFASEAVEEDYVQARMLWEVLGKQAGQQTNLVNNIAGHLKAASTMVQMKAFGKYSLEYHLLCVVNRLQSDSSDRDV